MYVGNLENLQIRRELARSAYILQQALPKDFWVKSNLPMPATKEVIIEAIKRGFEGSEPPVWLGKLLEEKWLQMSAMSHIAIPEAIRLAQELFPLLDCEEAEMSVMVAFHRLFNDSRTEVRTVDDHNMLILVLDGEQEIWHACSFDIPECFEEYEEGKKDQRLVIRRAPLKSLDCIVHALADQVIRDWPAGGFRCERGEENPCHRAVLEQLRFNWEKAEAEFDTATSFVVRDGRVKLLRSDFLQVIVFDGAKQVVTPNGAQWYSTETAIQDAARLAQWFRRRTGKDLCPSTYHIEMTTGWWPLRKTEVVADILVEGMKKLAIPQAAFRLDGGVNPVLVTHELLQVR